MELALELGMPLGTMTRSMTEAEFREWQHFAAKRMLPARRIELQLARICHLIAVTMGGAKEATVQDYMLTDPEEPAPLTAEDEVEAAKDVFQFRPRTARKVQE